MGLRCRFARLAGGWCEVVEVVVEGGDFLVVEVLCGWNGDFGFDSAKNVAEEIMSISRCLYDYDPSVFS